MAIIIRGKSECPLCGNVLQVGDDIMGTPHFLPFGPLSRYSDAGMHRKCFAVWPKAAEFRSAFNEVGRSWPGGPRQMLESGEIVKGAPDELPPRNEGKQRIKLAVLGDTEDRLQLTAAIVMTEHGKEIKSGYRVSCDCGGEGADPSGKPPSAALFCESCGRVLAPEKHPIAFDAAKYRLFLISGDPKNREQVKAVARAANTNLVTARGMFERLSEPVFSGRAVPVLAEKVALEMAGLTVRIEPTFPWA